MSDSLPPSETLRHATIVARTLRGRLTSGYLASAYASAQILRYRSGLHIPAKR